MPSMKHSNDIMKAHRVMTNSKSKSLRSSWYAVSAIGSNLACSIPTLATVDNIIVVNESEKDANINAL